MGQKDLSEMILVAYNDVFAEAIYRDDGKENENMCDVLDVVENRGRAEAVSKIVTLLYGQGYMVKEIARMTGETEETVKDILHLL